MKKLTYQCEYGTCHQYRLSSPTIIKYFVAKILQKFSYLSRWLKDYQIQLLQITLLQAFAIYQE